MYIKTGSSKNIRNTKEGEVPSIRVPYPPELTVEEILKRRPDEKLGSRAPNRFFIYRLAYIKELRKRADDNFSMTKISPHISSSWSKESAAVKEEYKRLSDKVEERLKEIRKNETLVLISEKFPQQPPRSSQHSPSQQNQISSPELEESNIAVETIHNPNFYFYPTYPPYDQFYPINSIVENNQGLQMDYILNFNASSFYYDDAINYEYLCVDTPCFWLMDGTILDDGSALDF
jgi:hypothetical protein